MSDQKVSSRRENPSECNDTAARYAEKGVPGCFHSTGTMLKKVVSEGDYFEGDELVCVAVSFFDFFP